MENVEDFKKEIEELRLEMYEAYAKDPNGNKVLTISQQLDKVINKVQKIGQVTCSETIIFSKKDVCPW